MVARSVRSGGAGYYLTSGYLPTFLKAVNDGPNSVSSLILMGESVVALVSISELIGWPSVSLRRERIL
jgi:MHS family proline/betaine transporter-like MFS transporter